MIRFFINNRLNAFERNTGESADYVREMLKYSPWGAFWFLLFMPLTAYRGKLSKDAYHVARIYTIRHEDCGPCLQTVVTMACQAGVDSSVIQAALRDDKKVLDAELALVAEFTETVLQRKPEVEELRMKLVERMGDCAVTDLALAIASVRVYPVVKRGMGHARSCSLVNVEVAVTST